MQISIAIAAEDWSSDFTESDDIVVKTGVVVDPGGLIVNMKAGNDELHLGGADGEGGIAAFNGTFGRNADIDGKSGNDFLIVTDQSVLTVGGRTTVVSVENIINDGVINANGGFDLVGTKAGETLSYEGGGTLTVRGGDFNVNTLAGDDTLLIESGSTITVQGADANFDGGSGADSFSNAGEVKTRTGDITISNFERVANSGNSFRARGDFVYTGTGGGDTFTNTGAVIAGGTASFDGLGGADVLDNSGKILGGAVTIEGIETVTNAGKIKADTNGVTYSGTAGDDSFANTGVVRSETAAGFDFGDGDDTLTNDGKIIVRSGNATFDGGAGADSFGNAGEVRTRTGDIVIANFETVTNSGNSFHAAGNFAYTGSAEDDTFTNTGSVIAGGTAAFDGLAGADVLTNGATGTMNFGLNGSTIDNFESVTNSGAMAFNTSGSNSGGNALTVDGDFNNGAGGVIDLKQNRIGDTAGIQGIFTSVATSRIDLDTQLTDGGLSDLIAAGAANGETTLDIQFRRDRGERELFGQDLLIVSSDGNGTLDAGVTINGIAGGDIGDGINLSEKLGGVYEQGLVDYWIRNNNGDVFVESIVDKDKGGGLVAPLASTISAVTTLFNKPISAFVSRCKATDTDGSGFGTWARGSGGTLETSSTGQVKGGNSESLSATSQIDYAGLQSGLDFASCDMGGGSTYHAGIIVGYIGGTSTQQDTSSGLKADFNTKSVGTYVALIHESGLTADATLRYDFHQFDLTHADPTLLAPDTEVDGSTISGSVGASYSYPLSDTIVVRPALGILIGRTSLDSFDLASRESGIDFEDQVTIMGNANLTLQKVFSVSDSENLIAFVNGSVFSDFGSDIQPTFTIFNKQQDVEMSNIGTFGQIGAGLTLSSAGGEPATQPDLLGTLRVDALVGDKIEGWGLTAQVRLQF